MSMSDLSLNSSVIKGLDSLSAKRITQEIKDGIKEVRDKFKARKKNRMPLEYKNVSIIKFI